MRKGSVGVIDKRNSMEAVSVMRKSGVRVCNWDAAHKWRAQPSVLAMRTIPKILASAEAAVFQLVQVAVGTDACASPREARSLQGHEIVAPHRTLFDARPTVDGCCRQAPQYYAQCASSPAGKRGDSSSLTRLR